MKNTLLLLVILTFSCAANAQDYMGLKKSPLQYCTSNQSPLQLLVGDTLVVVCDTMYLINKTRYQFYKSIHQATLQDDGMECKNLLKAYEARLEEHELSYSKLLANSRKTEKTTLDFIEYTQKSLENTQKTLQYSQQSLDYSMQNLDRANELIRKEKWNARGQKLLTGIAGVGVGILVGVLVTR
ncbi:hypothetical protein [Labilibaculum antarcticum]|uniref:Uncharacterized protein n=1 Tax=Labilibaculum antarcticum TaxID=1717717 RepID=A0A1Y1CQ86_9BACT|nr:hypothetical protein [Labilibaculum antarcticum]BAX82535.1 hypothetical protein ALGA_4244 [Labilibaculum antarcticum]